jgi:hypothetical protein
VRQPHAPVEGRPRTPTTPPQADPLPTESPEEEATGKTQASSFAILWFGIPLVIILAAVIVRVQCGGVT